MQLFFYGNDCLVAAASEQQLATMQEIAASANSMSQLAEELQELLNKFRL